LPIGTVEISGNIRTHLEGKGYFTPPNQPQINKWFWYSVTNMLAAVTDKMNRNASRFFIHRNRVHGPLLQVQLTTPCNILSQKTGNQPGNLFRLC
jgi:hypothetical protein